MCGYVWIHIDTHGYAWICMDMCGYARVRVDTQGYAWICMDMCGYAWVCVDMRAACLDFRGVRVREVRAGFRDAACRDCDG